MSPANTAPMPSVTNTAGNAQHSNVPTEPNNATAAQITDQRRDLFAMANPLNRIPSIRHPLCQTIIIHHLARNQLNMNHPIR